MAPDTVARLSLWGCRLSLDGGEQHTSRITMVLAFWQISDNVWCQLEAVELWYSDTLKFGIQKFCPLASCTQAGMTTASCSFMIEGFMACAACL
jgi:hypothetical protein